MVEPEIAVQGRFPQCFIRYREQMRADFAAEELVADRHRMAFCNHGSAWGGGVGKRLISFELKLAKIQAMVGHVSRQTMSGIWWRYFVVASRQDI